MKVPQLSVTEPPKYMDALLMQYLCETSTDKNSSGETSQPSEENFSESPLTPQQQKALDTWPETEDELTGDHRSVTLTIIKPTELEIYLKSLEGIRYGTISGIEPFYVQGTKGTGRKFYGRIIENEAPTFERPAHGVSAV